MYWSEKINQNYPIIQLKYTYYDKQNATIEISDKDTIFHLPITNSNDYPILQETVCR